MPARFFSRLPRISQTPYPQLRSCIVRGTATVPRHGLILNPHLVRGAGIDPASLGSKPSVLPMDQPRIVRGRGVGPRYEASETSARPLSYPRKTNSQNRLRSLLLLLGLLAGL